MAIFYILSLMVVVASALSACKTAKLSDADEALARGNISTPRKSTVRSIIRKTSAKTVPCEAK